MHSDTIHSSSQSSSKSDASTKILDQLTADIIKSLPLKDVSVLRGAGSAQAPFYFKSSTVTDLVNSTLYNDVIGRRVQGDGIQDGLPAAILLDSMFTNAYTQVYSSLKYQLSAADQLAQERMESKVQAKVRSLRPAWNNWVDQFDTSIPKLDMSNTISALNTMTGVMQTKWLNPSYEEKLRNDRSYPYEHMSDFDEIFNKIPLSVSTLMIDQIKDIYSAQGNAGGITAQSAWATQILTAIRGNLLNPTVENGGLLLNESTRAMISGLSFTPLSPDSITDALLQNPAIYASASLTVTKDKHLIVEQDNKASVGISTFAFLCAYHSSKNTQSSIFDEEYAGTKYSVKITMKNPTTQPMLTVQPELYNSSTGEGWMYIDPIKQAIKNGKNTNITGFVFDGGVPAFDFGEGGDFGYVSGLVFSQFIEISLTFENCTKSKYIREYFDQHSSDGWFFCGLALGGYKKSSHSGYTFSYSNETTNSITVNMKPADPGVTVDDESIENTLAHVVAASVTYPFVDATAQ